MHHHSTWVDVELSQCLSGLAPSLQSQYPIGALADGPAEGELANMTDDWHQIRFLCATSKAQFGEISMKDVQRLNALYLSQDIDSGTGGSLSPPDTTRLRRSGRSQQSQSPELVESLHNFVIDVLLIGLMQLCRCTAVAVFGMLTCDFFKRRLEAGVLHTVIDFLPLVIVPEPALSSAEVSTLAIRPRPEQRQENIRRQQSRPA